MRFLKQCADARGGRHGLASAWMAAATAMYARVGRAFTEFEPGSSTPAVVKEW
jgi:hypothetical protein